MIKLAGLKFDIYSDTLHNDLIKIAEAIPDFVKNTDLMDKEQLSHLSDGDFALCISTRDGEYVRLFPIIDKGHTWLAAYYFLKNAEKLPKEAQVIAASNIARALDYWTIPAPDGLKGMYKIDGLEDPMLQARVYREAEGESIPAIEEAQAYSKEASVKGNHYYERLADQEKIAFQVMQAAEEAKQASLKDDDFALVIKTAGSTERYFPISTAELLQGSMTEFDVHADSMDPRYRAKIAQAMEKKATELGVPAKSVFVQVYNPKQYSEKLAYHMLLRQELLSDNMQKLALDLMLEKAKDFAPAEFAEKLASFDEMTGLDRKWNAEIPDPYLSVAGFTKTAAIAGFDITEDELMQMGQNPESLKGILEDAMISEFASRPVEFFEALPKPHQNIIANLIRGRA